MCSPVSQGGLGIHSIENVNKALFGKWLWRVGRESTDGMWRQFFIGKYKLGNDGWFVSGKDFKASGMWKSILSIKDDFEPWICFRVHDGKRDRFLHDEWCGQNVLSHNSHLFPNLYFLDRRPQEFVAERYIPMSGHVVRDFCFQNPESLD